MSDHDEEFGEGSIMIEPSSCDSGSLFVSRRVFVDQVDIGERVAAERCMYPADPLDRRVKNTLAPCFEVRGLEVAKVELFEEASHVVD